MDHPSSVENLGLASSVEDAPHRGSELGIDSAGPVGWECPGSPERAGSSALLAIGWRVLGQASPHCLCGGGWSLTEVGPHFFFTLIFFC